MALRITREKFEARARVAVHVAVHVWYTSMSSCFQELGLNNKLMFANRKAVAGGLQMQAMPSRTDETKGP